MVTKISHSQVTEVGCLSVSQTEHNLQAQLKKSYDLFSGFEIRPYIGLDHAKKLEFWNLSIVHATKNCHSMRATN